MKATNAECVLGLINQGLIGAQPSGDHADRGRFGSHHRLSYFDDGNHAIGET
jgi:hypothetical protein